MAQGFDSAVTDDESSIPNVVARRFHDLLLSFPAASVGGVQWKVTVRKYKEHHGDEHDAFLSHGSPAQIAATLCRHTSIHIVETEDVNNPTLAIADRIALTPNPGLLGCWPSLYRALCSIVLEHGFPEVRDSDPSVEGTTPVVVASLLLAQLRPLMLTNWHAKFDESSMGYFDDGGHFKRLKKVKHMLAVLFRLREQRQVWQESRGLEPSEVDKAIIPVLEMVPSPRHQDMMLRCTAPANSEPANLDSSELIVTDVLEPEPSTPTSAGTEVHCTQSMTGGVCEASNHELQLEVERLRAENRKLRARNLFLEDLCTLSIPEAGISPPSSPGRRCRSAELDEDIKSDFFDNPYEPPPEKKAIVMMQDGAPSRQSRHSSSDYGSTDIASSAMAANFSGWQSGCTSANISGSTTPAVRSPFVRPGCAYVPMWIPFMNAAPGFDLSIIPSGIVRNVCAKLETQ